MCDYGDRRWQTCCSPRIAENDDDREMLQTREVVLSSAPHADDDTTPTKTRFIVEDDSVLFSIAVLYCLILVLFCFVSFCFVSFCLFCFVFDLDGRVACFDFRFAFFV